MLKEIPIVLIDRDPSQPRHEFDAEGLRQLAASIRENGLLQPIAVRPVKERYQLIAGERRYRSVKSLGWETIPANVIDCDQEQFRKFQLLENVVRRDLNPVEYARALKQMQDEGMSAQAIADCLGCNLANIAWYVKILGCREEVLTLVATGQLKTQVANGMANLSENGQMMLLGKFNSGKYDYSEQLALVQTQFGVENQGEMFADTKLNPEQQRVSKLLAQSIQETCRLFIRLHALEDKTPGAVLRWSSAGNVDTVRQEVAGLKKELTWLDRILRQEQAVSELAMGDSDATHE